MTERALLAGDHEPAQIPGYGPVPARDRALAGSGRGRRRPATATDVPVPTSWAQAAVWLRRLFTHPVTGQLVAMESRARPFPPALRRLLVVRDQVCRTPWCDALVRHGDHVVPVARGGRTERGQRPGAVRAVQLRQGVAGLVGRAGSGQLARPAPRRDGDPDRAPLRLSTTTAPRQRRLRHRRLRDRGERHNTRDGCRLSRRLRACQRRTR